MSHIFGRKLLMLLVSLTLIKSCLTQRAEYYQFEDINADPFIFETHELPQDEDGESLPRYMASVGNGHVATNVYTDTLFMNGVFNGFKGESHRARIPSRNNVRVKPVNGDKITNHSFSLDTRKGIFYEIFNVNEFRVQTLIFAHQFYHTAIINQIIVEDTANEAGRTITLEVTRDPGMESDDFNMESEVKYESDIAATSQCGRTKEVEDPFYQKETRSVCRISSNLPEKLTISRSERFTFITTYDTSLEGASKDFKALANLIAEGNHEQVLESHRGKWEKIWMSGRIELEGNLALSKIINGCFYYILSSLPIIGPINGVLDHFHGLCPGGLANGGKLTDYQGHVFWDSEIWISPPILYFFPEAAREILNYRLRLVPAARDRAVEYEMKGVRFPWESCFTGREVTPDCCPETRDFQIHNTGDISFAIRQYLALTRDLSWLNTTQMGYVASGFQLALEIAEFWISKTSYDAEANQHDIRHVMPPDEDHWDKDNSVYTNVIAAYSIFFAKYAECLLQGGDGVQKNSKIPNKWMSIAKSLKLTYDPHLNYHPEYEGYPVGELIKKADVILLGFPLMYPMEPEQRRNDLLLYGNATRRNGPAMTWAMHTIGFLELEDMNAAEELFNRSYQPYYREPFKIWTEAQPPTLGAINFLTAMGGFLQAVISGYGGLRLKQEGIIFLKPRLVPHTTALRLYGLKYLGNVLDVEIREKSIALAFKEASKVNPLSIHFSNGSNSPLLPGGVLAIALPIDTFEIKSTETKCPLPYDRINENYQQNIGSLIVHTNCVFAFTGSFIRLGLALLSL